jgi:hypothetical protein
VQLQQLQAVIDAADGNRAQISSIVREAVAAGRLEFAGAQRLIKKCNALANPTTCLGEPAVGYM